MANNDVRYTNNLGMALIKSITLDPNIFEGYRCKKCSSFIGTEEPSNKWQCTEYIHDETDFIQCPSKEYYKSYNHVYEIIENHYKTAINSYN